MDFIFFMGFYFFLDKRRISVYAIYNRNLGGFPMNDRNLKMNSLFSNEALSASFFGFFFFMRSVVKGDALRL